VSPVKYELGFSIPEDGILCFIWAVGHTYPSEITSNATGRCSTISLHVSFVGSVVVVP
jgi:hypothetical protein